MYRKLMVVVEINKSPKFSERQRREKEIKTKHKSAQHTNEISYARQDVKSEVEKKQSLDRAKVENLIKRSNRILLKISTVFPFALFPTIVTIEDTKIVVTFYSFFSVREAKDVDIKNIANIFVGNGPFLSFIEIISSAPVENKIYIRKLWKKDALKARNIIEGLRILQKENISTTAFEKEELLEKLNQLTKKDIA